jgi:hypothetical protein
MMTDHVPSESGMHQFNTNSSNIDQDTETNVGLVHLPPYVNRKSIQACKTRAILTEDQAIAIFRTKLLNDSQFPPNRVSASDVSQQYGVNEKTIRDIWKGRTWLRETVHLDPSLISLCAKLNLPGRPKGPKGMQGVESDTHTKTGRKISPNNDGITSSSVYLKIINHDEQSSNATIENPIPCAVNLQGASQLNDEFIFTFSSGLQDPFHDDWPFWPKAGE